MAPQDGHGLPVAFLRRAWLNLDTVWAVAIVVAGVGTLLT